MKKFILFIIVAIFIAIGLTLYQYLFTNKNISLDNSNNLITGTKDIADETIIAENLEVPWAMDFLPNGRLIFTERAGRISLIESDGSVKQIGNINVESIGESGLHGIAVDPNFEDTSNIFVYYTYSTNGGNTANRVSRFSLNNDTLSNEEIIVDNIPGAPNHDGGRIKFGPDGNLYITTGDAQEPSSSQNRNSLAGKILRVDKDGKASEGNLFNTRVFSYGHRNSQGLTWDKDGNLWSTEHGRSGALSGLDELNKIIPGGNYGWPEIEGNETRSGMITPTVNSGGSITWAPGGAAYLNNSIFFTGLRGSALYEYKIDSGEIIEHFKDTYGRIRDVVSKDNLLYISTSNKDGRGNPNENDDKIIRINPDSLSRN